jgi:hypothetical protein
MQLGANFATKGHNKKKLRDQSENKIKWHSLVHNAL